MAKILAPYVLCPLAERRRFVGVSQDSESSCVIVTLARNIVIRYRLSDQKQVSSWSTKNMLSAPVIYDHSSKLYYGTFNSEEISWWKEQVVSLGKLNKIKFTWLIHSVVSSEDCPAVIVYQNGCISSLKTDLARSKKESPSVKEDQLLSADETIKDARLVSLASVHYVAMYTSNESGDKFLHLMPVDQDRGTRSSVRLCRQSGVNLTAHAILDGDSPQLVTLWADGELYSLDLPIKSYKFPGKIISTVRCINPTHPAVLLPLGEEHLVLYGAAPNSEGAYLVILSRQFALPESMTKMKVYDEESRMWTCRNNIVLVLGGHLIVAPFRLDTVKLVSLLGVDKPSIEDDPIKEAVSPLNDDSNTIASRINVMKELGETEYFICDIILDGLLEAKNAAGLKQALDCISDIPDKWLVRIASFALDRDDEKLLKKLLRLPITGDNATLTLVRQKLMLTSALKLMAIVTNMLKEDEIDKCVLDWASLLCDSHYLQCLLSKDDQVVSTVRDLKDAVEEHIDSMVTYRSLLAEINYFKRGKVTSKTPSAPSHSYVVEKIKLY